MNEVKFGLNKLTAQIISNLTNLGYFLKYSICYEDTPQLANVWNQGNLFLPSDKPNPCKHFLTGKTVESVIASVEPFALIDQNGDITGADVDILNTIAEKLDFKTNLEFEPSLGAPVEGTGYWNGAIGKVSFLFIHLMNFICITFQVQNATSLIGMGSFIILYSRTFAIDFVQELYPLNIKILSPKPKELPRYLNTLKPLSLTSWMATFSSILFAMLFYPSLTRLSQSLSVDHSSTFDFVKQSLNMFAVVFGQGK